MARVPLIFMADFDLILLLKDETLTWYRPTAQLGEKLRNGEDVDLFGHRFKNFGACCEWLEVVDDQTKQPIGIQLVDFYEDAEPQSVAGLKNRNVIWSQQGEATCLFTPSNRWVSQGGPYLPVSYLASDAGAVCYFIREGLPTECENQALALAAFQTEESSTDHFGHPGRFA